MPQHFCNVFDADTISQAYRSRKRVPKTVKCGDCCPNSLLPGPFLSVRTRITFADDNEMSVPDAENKRSKCGGNTHEDRAKNEKAIFTSKTAMNCRNRMRKIKKAVRNDNFHKRKTEKVSPFSEYNVTFAVGYSSYAKRCISLRKIGLQIITYYISQLINSLKVNHLNLNDIFI